eukprot:m.42956 g.42956  ORF g.42956 m.42956 type:complete len:81 (+) comp10751_c0_seq1:807-1049(+)
MLQVEPTNPGAHSQRSSCGVVPFTHVPPLTQGEGTAEHDTDAAHPLANTASITSIKAARLPAGVFTSSIVPDSHELTGAV